MTDSTFVEPLLRSIATAERHIASEYVDDLEGTMATVGAEPRYALMPQPGVIAVVAGRDNVATFYETSRDVFVPQVSRFVTQFSSDWYAFYENIPTRRCVADGQPRTVHTATLLVCDRDGIKGEFLWERQSHDYNRPPAAQAPIPDGSVRSLRLHEEFLAALCEGNGVQLRELLQPNCVWAERDYRNGQPDGSIFELRGVDETLDYFLTWHSDRRPERISIVNRQATDWYVFAEELWIVRGPGGKREAYRKVGVYAVSADGRFEGAIGFGTDYFTPTSAFDRTLGQAYWMRIDRMGMEEAFPAQR